MCFIGFIFFGVCLFSTSRSTSSKSILIELNRARLTRPPPRTSKSRNAQVLRTAIPFRVYVLKLNYSIYLIIDILKTQCIEPNTPVLPHAVRSGPDRFSHILHHALEISRFSHSL